ncbi:MAG: metal-dependent hydrolase [Candidatus Pacearchaeota archaeon]|jgi:inner membrane protein
MYLRTHFIIALFFGLLFMKFFENKIIFLFIVLISCFIPDIDTKFSKIGKKKIFRIFQLFFTHRGVFHSFSFLILICIFLYFWKPFIAFGFLIGYGSHLIFDSFTKTGIYVFWPLKLKFHGFIKTGGKLEFLIFILFLIMDFLLIFYKIYMF